MRETNQKSNTVSRIRFLRMANRAEKYIGCSSVHLGHSEIELFFPSNANGRKTKGLHHPGRNGIYTPSLDVTVNSFSTGSQPVAMYRNQDITREAAAPPPDPFIRSSAIRFSFSSTVFSPPSTKGIRNNSSNSWRETGSTFTRNHAGKSWHNRRG